MRKRHNRTFIAMLAAALVLTGAYSLTGCGDTPVEETVASTEIATETSETTEAVETTETEVETEATETVVPEEKLNTETTEATEATEVAETTETVESTETVPAEAENAYTFTDMDAATMYAKGAVNVRDLPSTDGSRLGSLSKNQEVTVTGQCNETGWYRIAWEGGTACVSSKYLSTDKAVEPEKTESADANAGTQTANADTTMPIVIELELIPEPTTTEPYFDRAMGEEIWGYVNAERAAAGLNTLTWDEEVYNFTCQRAQEIVTNFSHDGNKDYYGENILYTTKLSSTAYDLHMMWYNSKGHHDNYMDNRFASGACVIYYCNGKYYGVENFAFGSTPTATISSSNYRTVNGVDMDLTANEAAAFDAGHYWTASNGVVLFIIKPTSCSMHAGGDEANAAMAEFDACHTVPYY